MRKTLLGCGLFLLLAGAAAFADDKPDPKDKPQAPAEKYLHLGSVRGVVQNTPGEDGVVTIKVTIRYLEPNVQAQQNLVREEQQLLARQAAAMYIRNPIQRQQEFIRIYQSAQNLGRENLFNVKEVQKDLEFETVDETKYRIAVLPVAYDDKGDLKKYTPDEIKELKGTEHLPGYAADHSALHSGQPVVIAAARRKPATGEKEIAEEKPVATMILMLGE